MTTQGVEVSSLTEQCGSCRESIRWFDLATHSRLDDRTGGRDVSVRARVDAATSRRMQPSSCEAWAWWVEAFAASGALASRPSQITFGSHCLHQYDPERLDQRAPRIPISRWDFHTAQSTDAYRLEHLRLVSKRWPLRQPSLIPAESLLRT
jgi:hypothetical protein